MNQNRYVFYSLVVLALVMITVASSPELRGKVRSWTQIDKRQIVAKTSGYLQAQGPWLTVLKIMDGDGFWLEVYTSEKEDTPVTLISRIALTEKKDAYFQFQGNATNLVLTDVDQDGKMEIIAPTYDDQMVPRLNVYKYNANINGFERHGPM